MQQVKLSLLQKNKAKLYKKSEDDSANITKEGAKQQLSVKSTLATGMSAINSQMTSDITKKLISRQNRISRTPQRMQKIQLWVVSLQVQVRL